jgi:hypothetical protein
MTAEMYQGCGQLTEAGRAITAALAALPEVSPVDLRVRIHTLAGKIALRRTDLDEAERHGYAALDTLDAQRALTRDQANPEWQALGVRATEVLLETLAEAGADRALDALRVLETSKVRTADPAGAVRPAGGRRARWMLARRDLAYSTGQVIMVDGGMTLARL